MKGVGVRVRVVRVRVREPAVGCWICISCNNVLPSLVNLICPIWMVRVEGSRLGLRMRGSGSGYVVLTCPSDKHFDRPSWAEIGLQDGLQTLRGADVDLKGHLLPNNLHTVSSLCIGSGGRV